MQTVMPKGIHGKFDVVCKSTLTLHGSNKQVDKTLKKEKMTQSIGKCAAAYTCLAGSMPISTKQQCVLCDSCLHPECGYELNETPTYKIPSTNINLICHACTIGGDLEKFAHDNEVSLGLYK